MRVLVALDKLVEIYMKNEILGSILMGPFLVF